MSPEDFGEVDVDLLADYVGGALDGDDEATVSRLIAEDPAWRSAWEILAPGMASVQTALRSLPDEPMPPDVAARLEAALASPIADVTPIKPALIASTEPHLEPVRGDDRHLAAVPSGTGSTAPARRRGRLRWAAPIAAAAGVLAFAGVGIEYLADSPQVNTDSAASAGGSAEAAPMIASDSADLVTPPGDDRILATGADYRRRTLADASARTMAVPAESGSGEVRKSASVGSDAADPELQRLRAGDALLACLKAIAREKKAGPITVDTVDYARFESRPALVVTFSAGGVSWVWATGPECGTPAAGANRLSEVRVG